jgi:hypothetical protein
MKSCGHLQRRRVPDVVGVRLERGAEHADQCPSQRPTCQFQRQIDHPDPAPHIYRVHLAQERERLPRARLVRAGQERTYVPWQAATTEPEPGAQEGCTDTRVSAKDLGQDSDISPGGPADLGHRVDERDLRSQERIRRGLRQLGGSQIRHEELRASRERRCVNPPQDRLRMLRLNADHDPVRPQGVVHSVAFAQKLRIPGEFRGLTRWCQLREFAG